MSVNDPDGAPYSILNREEFVRILMVEWHRSRESAEAEWEKFNTLGRPPTLADFDEYFG